MSTTTVELGKVGNTPKGVYNYTLPYERLDIVSYNGSSYMAKQDVPVGISILNEDYWLLLAHSGTPTDSQVAQATSNWLQENVDITTPIIDKTLLISGAAADSQKTGLMTATQFSSTATYAVGSYVNYKGSLYRCVNEIVSPGQWSGSINWVPVSLANDVNILKNQVDTLNEGGLVIKDEIIERDIQDWLDEHPEATTTVEDRTLTKEKFTTDTIKFLKTTGKVIFMPTSNNSEGAAGDCTVFITNITEKVIMIDSGAQHSYELIKEQLDINNITHINYFILTHYHGDHFGNVNSMIEDGYIDNTTIIYLPRTKNVEINNWDSVGEANLKSTFSEYVEPSIDNPLIVEDFQFDFFNCEAEDYEYYDTEFPKMDPSRPPEELRDCNAYSVCCYVTFGKVKILMTGDISIVAETYLHNKGYIKKCDILKIPHHGHHSTADYDFYLKCMPTYAIVPTRTPAIQSFQYDLDSDHIRYLNILKTHVYCVGSGPIFIGLLENSYSVIPSGPEVSSVFYNNVNKRVLRVYVRKDYTGTEVLGTQDKPYKTITEAIAGLQYLKDNKMVQIIIKIDGEYDGLINRGDRGTDTERVEIYGFKPAISIVGDPPDASTHPSNYVTIFSLSVSGCSVDVSYVNIIGNIPIPCEYLNGSVGTLSAVVINGNTRNASDIMSSRGISVNRSFVYLDACTISNKRVAIVVQSNGVVNGAAFKGTNNEYGLSGYGGERASIGAGSNDFNCEYPFYVTNIPVKNMEYKNKYYYSVKLPYTVCKLADVAAATTTETVDLSDSYYTRTLHILINAFGAIYLIRRWGGSVSVKELLNVAAEDGKSFSVSVVDTFKLRVTYEGPTSLIRIA